MPETTSIPNVYFTSDISANGIISVFAPWLSKVKGRCGFKVHFGEDGNTNFLSPKLIQPLIEQLNGAFVETNVLYVSRRRYTKSHIALAKEHGFDFAPIAILDEKGDKVIKCDLPVFKEVHLGAGIDDFDTLILYSHFKGHGMSGFGGAIKNASMGLASIPGKMALHASKIPTVDTNKCINCGLCLQKCPANAITVEPVVIDEGKCIGCGSCIGFCPQHVFNVPWGSTSRDEFFKRLAEYALVASQNTNMIYINVLANISTGCDCMSSAPPPFLSDIGIVAGYDMIAVEKASHDLVNKAYKKGEDAFLCEVGVSGIEQVEYAASLGLGSLEYNLINVD